MERFASIGKRIREARKKIQMTQLELGRLTGYTDSTISHIEKGEVDLPISKVKALAEALRVTVDYLIEDYLLEVEYKPGDIFNSLPKETQEELIRELERKLIMEGIETWQQQRGTEKDGVSELKRMGIPDPSLLVLPAEKDVKK